MNKHASVAAVQPTAVNWPPAPRNKWEREYRAFRKMLPSLLQSHRDKYVAVHNEQVIDSDADEMALILRTLAKVGNVDVHVGLVTDQQEPTNRSGVVRELPPKESA